MSAELSKFIDGVASNKTPDEVVLEVLLSSHTRRRAASELARAHDAYVWNPRLDLVSCPCCATTLGARYDTWFRGMKCLVFQDWGDSEYDLHG